MERIPAVIFQILADRDNFYPALSYTREDVGLLTVAGKHTALNFFLAAPVLCTPRSALIPSLMSYAVVRARQGAGAGEGEGGGR